MAETKVTLLNVVDRGVFDSISDEDKQGNIYFVREGTPTNTNMLSLYVGTSKQCDVLDISDVPGIDLNNEYNNYNIPEQYQIKNKLLFIEQSDSIDNNTTFYKALMWNGEKFLDCFGTPRNVIVCQNLPSTGVNGYVYIELSTRKIYIYENGFISLVSSDEYATNEYVLSVYNTLLNIISEMSSGSVSTAGNVIYSFPGCSETVNGWIKITGVITSGTGSSSTNFIVPGNYDIQGQLLVIALNSEASTYDLNIAVTVNSTAVQMDNVAYNAYSGSGTNRRNYRVVSCDKLFSASDTVSISVTNRSGYTSFVYALVDSTLKFGEVQKLLSTADAPCSGSNDSDGIVVYGTFNSNSGGTINVKDYMANTTITTDNPGSNYKSAYIFFFERGTT